MEFFVEGTRSCSGKKSLHPRLGRQIRTFLKLECCRSMVKLHYYVQCLVSLRGSYFLTNFLLLGLLPMVIEPYLEGRVPDILMVPFSISYERTLEELLFAREQLGVPKPKESTSVIELN